MITLKLTYHGMALLGLMVSLGAYMIARTIVRLISQTFAWRTDPPVRGCEPLPPELDERDLPTPTQREPPKYEKVMGP